MSPKKDKEKDKPDEVKKDEAQPDTIPAEASSGFDVHAAVADIRSKWSEKHPKMASKRGDSIARAGDEYDNANIKTYISLGTTALDVALGGLGIPGGRVTEIVGEPSSGKSLLLEAAAITAQKRGGAAAIIDSEMTFNKARFAAAGGSVKDVVFIEANDLEEGFEVIKLTIDTFHKTPQLKDKPIVIGWDTICTDMTRNQASGNMYGGGMIEGPKVIKQGLREILEVIAKTSTTLMILNQVYSTPKADAVLPFGMPKVVPGGHGLQFYSSVIAYLADLEPYISPRTGGPGAVKLLTIYKCKVTVPMMKVVLCCDSYGVDDISSIHYNLERAEKISKGGAWLNTELPGEGKISWMNVAGFHEKCAKHPGLIDFMAQKLWEVFSPPQPAFTKADASFLAKYKAENPWIEEGKQYSLCAISGHYCPTATWHDCRTGFFTKCAKDLPDVKPLKRIYHETVPIEADLDP